MIEREALGIGFGTGTLFKIPYKDRRTLTIETGIQNSGLGLVLLFNPAIFDPTIWSHNGAHGISVKSANGKQLAPS